MLRISTSAIATAALLGCNGSPPPEQADLQWWKGNLHAHSLWSDGDDYPEMVIDWYKEHGYHFIQLTEHNTLTEGEKWIEVARRGGQAAYEAYAARFGPDWVVERIDSMGLHVRLKTLVEYRALFEAPERFLVMQGEEITDAFDSKPVHLNATNVLEPVSPQHGSSVREVIQNNVDAVLEQRARTGHPMIVHLNHPNYGWAVTAEDLIAVGDGRFFEVYNGHPAVRNEGDEARPGTERLWDLVLTERLRLGMSLIFGIAVDDAHNYHELGADRANAGRGWIMVRAARLAPDALILAMESGDFYGSTGVVLEDIVVESDRLSLRIRPEAGVTHTTQFIGTYRGHPDSEIGTVLAEVAGSEAEYQFRGDELYVRAKVISSRLNEVAWTQPVTPAGSLGRAEPTETRE